MSSDCKLQISQEKEEEEEEKKKRRCNWIFSLRSTAQVHISREARDEEGEEEEPI